ncbi:hypothetical protein GV794_20690 [Nocardia cyriacigeorgica]|uniref:Uncharacterized protein n=1 Tax=Nocardia cyriacigeorgica TaxID=135487 RepID=A0ABX0CRN5_9NOCA|nr:hypothetical protein [Nocardia cyriacigeorgica]NEW58053.1 hypothetical protein [Nocardia cyriacigeorgica]
MNCKVSGVGWNSHGSAAKLVMVIAAAAMIAASLTGCAQRITGDANAAGTAATYRQGLSAEQRAALLVSDQIRRLDPCGFINDAAIATLGTPAYFGGSQGFDECHIAFRPKIGAAGITGVGST